MQRRCRTVRRRRLRPHRSRWEGSRIFLLAGLCTYHKRGVRGRLLRGPLLLLFERCISYVFQLLPVAIMRPKCTMFFKILCHKGAIISNFRCKYIPDLGIFGGEFLHLLQLRRFFCLFPANMADIIVWHTEHLGELEVDLRQRHRAYQQIKLLSDAFMTLVRGGSHDWELRIKN